MARGGSFGPGKYAGIKEERERQEAIRRKEQRDGNIAKGLIATLGAIGTALGYFLGKEGKK